MTELIVADRIQIFEALTTDVFDRWLSALADQRAMAKIASRIERLASGNPGDVRPVGGGISELRIHYGPGYRVYYRQTGTTIVILLCGGDKASQARDIERAREIASNL